MANLDFYALAQDQSRLLDFIFSETDLMVYELSSEFDAKPRSFRSVAEIEKFYNLGVQNSARFQLWSPSVMEAPVCRRIELTGVANASFRYAVEGAGLIQLFFNGIESDLIYHSHYGHWSEAGARSRSKHPADDVDWKSLSRISGKIQRFIRNRLSVAKLFARPILPDAFETIEKNFSLSFSPEKYGIGSPDIIINA